MSKGIVEVIAGAALIAVDVAFLGANPPLIMVGAGLVIGGIGSILNKKLTGMAADTINPIAPRNAIYGRGETGGTTIFLLDTGETNKYLHMVRVLAAHPCEALDAVRFDNKRLPLDADGNSISFQDATAVIGSQQTVNITNITRRSGTVTVTMAGAMPLPAAGVQGGALIDGDQVQIQNVTTDQTLNGQYQVQIVNSTTFIYVNGGVDVSIGAEGQVVTLWPDYGDTVHMEVALGAQTIADPPFPGLLAGDDTGSNGLWTDHHTLTNCTAVYMRLKYGGNTYASGLPTIRFQLRGKNDILDPRLSPGIGYTENAALCIADYLSNDPFGFRATYGTEIPLDPLIAAANICDETIPLASGASEPRYTCNGGFLVSVKRGEVLENMLTSCGGRLTYSGGQFIIHPAAWPGTPATIGGGASATLHILTSHIEGSPSTGGALCSVDGLSLFNRGWLSGGGAWTLRTDSTTVDGNNLGALNVLFAIGTASPVDLTTPEDFLIYDCWVDVTYPDGTTATLRPNSAAVDITVITNEGTIADPGNAIDGDPATAATIERTHLSTIVFSPALRLSGFVGPDTPNTTPAGIIASKAATALMAGPFQWKPKLSARNLYNGVKGTYVCPANNWQASDIPPYAQDTLHGYLSGGSPMYPEGDANLFADGGERRWKDIQLPFTIFSGTAQRLEKIELMRGRQQGAGTFVFNLAMYKFTALDIVSVTLPFLGWYGKILEISAHRFTVNKQQNGDNEVTLLGTELDLQETSSTIYDWSTSEELNGQGGQQTVFPNSAVRTVAPPTSVAAVSGTSVATVGADGVTVSRVKVTWTPPPDGFVTNGGFIEVQYQLASSPLSAWIGVGQFDPSAGVAFIDGVSDGVTYNVRVRSVNTAGAVSDWVTTTVTASGSSLHRIDDEIPAGLVNGANLLFTLSEVPSPAASLQLFRNGNLMIQGLDYSLGSPVSHTINFEVAPLVNDSLRAFYWY